MEHEKLLEHYEHISRCVERLAGGHCDKDIFLKMLNSSGVMPWQNGFCWLLVDKGEEYKDNFKKYFGELQND